MINQTIKWTVSKVDPEIIWNEVKAKATASIDEYINKASELKESNIFYEDMWTATLFIDRHNKQELKIKEYFKNLNIEYNNEGEFFIFKFSDIIDPKHPYYNFEDIFLQLSCSGAVVEVFNSYALRTAAQ